MSFAFSLYCDISTSLFSFLCQCKCPSWRKGQQEDFSYYTSITKAYAYEIFKNAYAIPLK